MPPPVPVPAAKLIFLGMRQAARPVSKVAMSFAEENPTFRSLCVRAARWSHRHTRRLSQPLGSRAGAAEGDLSKMVEDVAVKAEMPEAEAVQNGCSLLGEFVVFSVSGAVLTYEYVKTKESERRRHVEEREAVRQEALEAREVLAAEVRLLNGELAKQSARIQALQEEAEKRRRVEAGKKKSFFW